MYFIVGSAFALGSVLSLLAGKIGASAILGSVTVLIGLLGRRNRRTEFSLGGPIELQVRPSGGGDDPEYEDWDYENFVDAMWQRPGIDLRGIPVGRVLPDQVIDCRLERLVKGANGFWYINLFEEGRRKTFATDKRHRWVRNGKAFDNSAFTAISRGCDPDLALVSDSYPTSIEDALRDKNNRFPTNDRKLVICYENSKSEISYRVISRVVRQRDTFSARCHFRWGERRTFLYDGLRQVVAADTGEVISLEKFQSGSKKKSP